MRVYEIAKRLNVSNKELLEQLAKAGFEVKSHMAVLAPEVLDFINKKYERAKEAPKAHLDRAADTRKSLNKKGPVEIGDARESLPSGPTEEPQEQGFLVASMSAAQLAEGLSKPVSEVVLALLKQGIVCSKNQILPEAAVEQLVKTYGISIRHQVFEDKEVKAFAIPSAEASSRLPIVVVLGHVDHGKTTLLDFIRKTRVAQKEKGGITQHLGAYEAKTPHGNLVFIDTPGHEAFSSIRGRGVRVADLAVLVIAADDSIKPQTIEAIEKIKKADIPVVVAINKIDRVDAARVEVINGDLARYDLLPEAWGGDTIVVPISAKLGDGIDKLLEMIVLQSQIMNLRADLDRSASGFVLESRLQKGLGPVATVICQQGILHQGDYFSAGSTCGRASSLVDSYGKRVKEAGPSVPIQVAGFSELPHAGDFFEVISQEKFKKLRSAGTARIFSDRKKLLQKEALNVVVKVDSSSSREALVESIGKLLGQENLYLVYGGVGDISESDVMLAANTGSVIVGLHVKIESNAIAFAQQNDVKIERFDIIYKLLEYLEEKLKRDEPVKLESRKAGEAVIRKVFNIKGIGVVAGSYCKEGIFSRSGRVIAWRGKEKVGEGAIKSLERDRKPVKEVHAGFEFAFVVDGIDDWQIDDRAECFIEVPAKKT